MFPPRQRLRACVYVLRLRGGGAGWGNKKNTTNKTTHVPLDLTTRHESCEPRARIVCPPQKISSHPTGQGAALRTNLPSISLGD